MKLATRLAALAAVSGITSQPCLGALPQGGPALVTPPANAAGPDRVQFDLASVRGPVIASASISLAASQQVASEQTDVPRRKGIPKSTLLIVGGVLLAVVVLAAVASAMPTAGPREGAFD
jgi:hypothetical protein